jgi:hypothetical protein
MTIGGTALVPPLHWWYRASSTSTNGGTVPALPLLILETYTQKSKVLVFELGWVVPCEQHHCTVLAHFFYFNQHTPTQNLFSPT